MKTLPLLLTTIILCPLINVIAVETNSIESSYFAKNSGQDLATNGWRLWLDTTASWNKDKVYLPEDVDLTKLPVNPPTGGWESLQETKGIAVTLPSTVEEHYWGKLGLRPYHHNYLGWPGDLEMKCGSYNGVSWWWRSFDAPVVPSGKRLVLKFRAARLRAEVYVNGKLCGYSIFANLPFEADITDAIKPDQKNQLAVRITNPGGNFEWAEESTSIGGFALNGGRGFGGLDADIQMQVRDQVTVSDLAILNKPNPHDVSVLVEVKSTGPAYNGPVDLTISRNRTVYWKGSVVVTVPARGLGSAKTEISLPNTELWTPDHPTLYTATATIPSFPDGGKETDFGFRWFAAKGIGTQAPKLVFNGNRIVLHSAISWGLWGNNGIFPDQALAEKEVNAAKSLGLNCLNFHRDIGRTVVMNAQDRMGLFRYEEPGTSLGEISDHNPHDLSNPTKGPIDTSGKGGETPTSWYERYCTEKTLLMVKRDRSHPCLVIYGLSNETGPNFKNPRLFAFMRQMHDLDPSRILLIKSGNTYKQQCFLLPYDPTFRYDDGTGYSGWYDQHGGCISGAWQDAMYKGPQPFSPLYLHSMKEFDPREIVGWGEAQITALPDNHAKIVADYQASGGGGYDRADHEQILAAYERFLDDYGFRNDFKTASNLFTAIAYKGYFAFQKSIEQMRMFNKTDLIVLNGWESTAIENHSGLVDVHRNLKGDPSLVKQAFAPELLVLCPHHLVLQPGDTETVDIHLVNEVNRKGPHTLNLKLVDADGTTEFETNRPVTVTGGDTFGELMTQGIEFTPKSIGTLKLTATITPKGEGMPLSRTEELFVVPSKKLPADFKIAVAGNVPWLAEAIKKQSGAATTSLSETNAFNAIVLSWQENLKTLHWRDGSEGSDPSDSDSNLYGWATMIPATATMTEFTRYSGLDKGAAQVELQFVNPPKAKPTDDSERIFDVALNGKTVLSDFNIAKESNGKRAVVAKKFTVDASTGVISLAFKALGKQSPAISAIKITDAAGKIIREYAGPEPWITKSGVTWMPLVPRVKELNNLVTTALSQVHDQGTRLVLLPHDATGMRMMAAALGDAGAWTYQGVVGPGIVDTGAEIWMGSWYFVRKHWLFDGLPTGCSMAWQYQVPGIHDAEGLLVNAPGLEVAAGFSRDHRTQIGMGAGVAPYGKGSIVFFTLPLMDDAINGKPDGIATPTAIRLLLNALAPKP
jgi:hypothetical protein